MSDSTFAGKTVLITGGSGGIGVETARLFARRGAKLMLVDLGQQALERVADEIGRDRCRFFAADVADAGQMANAVDATISAFAGVDVFVANAGIEGVNARIVDADVSEFDRVMAVNVRGVWLGLRSVLPHMMERGGNIVITSSVGGLRGSPGLSPYVASKHAVIGIAKSVAKEYARHNVRVNVVCPGAIDTRMMQSLSKMSGVAADQFRSATTSAIPLGRFGTPDEVARMIEFLASDASSYATGAVFVMDGGMTS